MEETQESQSEQGDDWLAGATIEFGGELGESTDIPLDGIEFGTDEYVA